MDIEHWNTAAWTHRLLDVRRYSRIYQYNSAMMVEFSHKSFTKLTDIPTHDDDKSRRCSAMEHGVTRYTLIKRHEPFFCVCDAPGQECLRDVSRVSA